MNNLFRYINKSYYHAKVLLGVGKRTTQEAYLKNTGHW
jgi:hypothetical protein